MGDVIPKVAAIFMRTLQEMLRTGSYVTGVLQVSEELHCEEGKG